jgi:putative ATPase
MFEVNAPLLSRSRVVEFNPLNDAEVRSVIRVAVDDARGYGGEVVLDQEAEDHIVLTAGGDARAALTTLELGVASAAEGPDGRLMVGVSQVRNATPTRQLTYDKSGDAHYDIISAFIKSMRGSDPDAAVYWLARMVHGGEDPKFIARRIFIFASEDIGNADPRALLVAHAAVKAAEFVGWPECRINLSQAAVYMALAPKSNASYIAIDRALEEVREGPRRDVPSHLRDRHRPGFEEYGSYLYPHDYPSGRVEQQYLPDGLERGRFYEVGSRGWEAERAADRRRDDTSS